MRKYNIPIIEIDREAYIKLEQQSQEKKAENKKIEERKIILWIKKSYFKR